MISFFIGIGYWFFVTLLSNLVINIPLYYLGIGMYVAETSSDIFLAITGYFISHIVFVPIGALLSLCGVIVGWYFNYDLAPEKRIR